MHHDHTDITLFEALNGTRAVKILNKLVPAVLEVLKRFLYKAVDPLDSVVKRCIRTDVLVETLRGISSFRYRSYGNILPLNASAISIGHTIARQTYRI